MDIETPTLTLSQLAETLPKPEAEALAVYTDPALRAMFVERGAQIASARVVTDAARIYGLAYDYFTRASEEQKKSLTGFSLELLAIGAHYALDLQTRVATAGEARHAGTVGREGRGEAARRAFSRGVGLRDHAYTVLRSVTGTNLSLRARVDAAVGTADDADALARGLEALARIGAELLKTQERGVALSVKLARLTDEYLRTLVEAADQVRSTARAGSAPSNDRLMQGELDWADGINLHLLGEVIRIFEASHDIDPSIPKLVPISTRRLLGKHKGKGGTTSPDPVPPTPPPAPAPAT